MGTQQILLIVLSVIIVGAAIAVGIQMFNNQAYSSNKSAIAADAQSYASQVVQYYKTPESQGGAGGKDENMTAEKIGGYIGFVKGTGSGETPWAVTEYGIQNDNGVYTIASADIDVTTAGAPEVTINGLGREEKGKKNPGIATTITFPAGTITAVASDEPVASGTGGSVEDQ